MKTPNYQFEKRQKELEKKKKKAEKAAEKLDKKNAAPDTLSAGNNPASPE